MPHTLLPRRRLLQAVAAAGLARPALSTMAQPADAAPMPQSTIGQIHRLSGLPWRDLPDRPVDVWLPPGYRPDALHDVLVMLDGQMAFDPRSTWNRQAWLADRAVAGLQRQGRLADTVVVAVHNRPDHRYAEYFPEAALALMPPAVRDDYLRRAQHGRALGEAHIRTLVEEVLPAVAARFPLRSGPAHTRIAGASMGGLAAWATLCRAPTAFGAAVALSTHWIGVPTAWRDEPGTAAKAEATAQALLQAFEQSLPAAGVHRLWIDRGDDALDSLYAPYLTQAEAVLRRRGWSASQAVVRTYPGTGHNEASWAARLPEALAWAGAPR